MHLQMVIDDGSNFIKTAHKKDGKTITAAFASRVVRKPLLDENMEASSASYDINGQVYSVDNSGVDVVPTNKREYQSSEVNRVLINHALRTAGATSADIILTLPVSQFFNPDLTKNAEAIEAKKLNAIGEITAHDGRECCKIKTVVVMPEGVPAFSHVKEIKQLENGGYLMVDIGGTTTDMVLFNEKNQIVNFISLPIGSLSMLNKFKAVCVATMNNDDISDANALHGLLNGKLGNHNLKEQADKCIAEFHDLINDNLQRLGDTSLLNSIIFSGGGAQLLTLDKTATISDAPQFDNANGCLKLFKD